MGRGMGRGGVRRAGGVKPFTSCTFHRARRGPTNHGDIAGNGKITSRFERRLLSKRAPKALALVSLRAPSSWQTLGPSAVRSGPRTHTAETRPRPLLCHLLCRWNERPWDFYVDAPPVISRTARGFVAKTCRGPSREEADRTMNR